MFLVVCFGVDAKKLLRKISKGLRLLQTLNTYACKGLSLQAVFLLRPINDINPAGLGRRAFRL
jgi:hypothetical protein